MMKSSNPAFRGNTYTGGYAGTERMTIQGTANKALLLIGLVFASASITWNNVTQTQEAWSQQAGVSLPGWFFPLMIGTFILSMVIIFKRTTAPYLSPFYAIMEGALLGLISAVYEAQFPGLVTNALLCTFGTFFTMLIAYRMEIIRATKTTYRIIGFATMGIMLTYVVDMIMNAFGSSVPYLHSSGPIGIGISAVIAGVAAFNLILDFDMIEKGAAHGSPKFMEWYSAFGLVITLVWLYMEILRLLSKMRER